MGKLSENKEIVDSTNYLISGSFFSWWLCGSSDLFCHCWKILLVPFQVFLSYHFLVICNMGVKLWTWC